MATRQLMSPSAMRERDERPAKSWITGSVVCEGRPNVLGLWQ